MQSYRKGTRSADVSALLHIMPGPDAKGTGGNSAFLHLPAPKPPLPPRPLGFPCRFQPGPVPPSPQAPPGHTYRGDPLQTRGRHRTSSPAAFCCSSPVGPWLVSLLWHQRSAPCLQAREAKLHRGGSAEVAVVTLTSVTARRGLGKALVCPCYQQSTVFVEQKRGESRWFPGVFPRRCPRVTAPSCPRAAGLMVSADHSIYCRSEEGSGL